MTRIREVKNKKIWERFVLSYRPGVFLQSWNWGEFHQSLGEKIIRLGFWEKGKLVGVALLIKEEAKRGLYLSCPGGPLISWSQERFFQEFIKYLRKLGKKEKTVFVRVRPSVLDNQENTSLFKKAGFVKAPMHMHAETTWQLTIGRDEEELLAGMRKNTRYSIRKAMKEGVKIIKSQNPKDVAILYRLQMEAAQRHKFIPFSKNFLAEQFKVFSADNQAILFKAEYKGDVLAISMIIFYGDTAVYHYSGSSSRFPKIPASYLIQWEAIKEAKKRSCKIYNFWGIAPEGKTKHRFAGVTTFKKGFGGERVNYLHAQDLPLSKKYWLIFIFESGRRFWRRL